MKDGRCEINGVFFWYKNGVLHCEDGPAIEFPDASNGQKYFFPNGVRQTEEQFNQWLDKKKLNEKLHVTLEEKLKDKKVKI